MITRRTVLLQVLNGQNWEWVFCWVANQGRIQTTPDFRKAVLGTAGNLRYFGERTSATLRLISAAKIELLANLELNKESLVCAYVMGIGCGSLFEHSRPMNVEVVQGGDPTAAPSIEFSIDERRCGSFFRVTYSIFLTAAGTPRELFCSAPAGLPHAGRDLRVGVP